MKTNAKKIILGLGLALLGSFAAKSQGVQNIIVEKYYKADANDVANATSNGAVVPLTTNHVTYRVFVKMAPGYQLNALYGDANHPWKYTTTTAFYNDPQFGAVVGVGTSTTNVRKATAMIDSYLTMGGAANNKQGVLKIYDTDGSIGNFNSILANNPGGVYGAPITGSGAADGLMTGTVQAATAVGFSTETDIFDQTAGGTFSVNAQSIAALGGAVGTTSDNIVFIGQFTTDGIFGFQLNMQVQATGSLTAENWVASNPLPGENTLSALTLAPPNVGITSPSNGANVITGNAVAITATATSVGTITSVEFKVDGVSIGTDLTAPYAASYTATSGSHTIIAIATDNNSLTATSSNVVITAAANQAPVVSVSAPAGPIIAPSVVTFTANAIDLDGTVSSLTLFVNNVPVGTSTNAGPAYTFTWNAVAGLNQNVTASATDNLGLVGNSSAVVFNVTANTPPVVAITAPLNGSSVIAPQIVTITATATDPGGSITLVEAFVNNISIGSYTTAGPNYSWTYATSTLTTLDVIKVVATDNSAATTTSSPVSVNVANPNALPYDIGEVVQQCNQGNFCLPIKAALTYTAANVIGYDLVLNYDATKVTPTGNVTINSALINPAQVTVINSINNGTMNISASINGNAPANTAWNGTGDIFCVEFNKIAANFASIETTTFAISALQESYFVGVASKNASNGSYTTFRDSLFDANIKFWSNGSAMGYTNAATGLVTNVYGTSSLCVPTNTTISVQPNGTGHFTYNIFNGSSISIVRDINNLTSVQLAINAGDQTIARNVLLNLATGSLTPNVYQMIALDVNLDGVISAGDLTQINQRAIDFIGEFKQAWNYNAAGTKTLTGFGSESKDWSFVDSVTVLNNPAYAISSSFPSNDNVGYSKAKVPSYPFCLTVPQTSLGLCPTIDNAVYRGIMIGDASGSFSSLSSTLQLRPSGDKVVIDLNKSIVNGNTIEVPVSFVSSKPIYGLDFAMKYDESELTYNSMVNFPSSTDALAYFNPNSKMLRFTCTNVNSDILPAGQPVASIRFETKNGVVDAEKFSELLGMLNGEQVAIEVLSRTVGISNVAGSDNAVSVFPNPTNGILNITSIGDATVQLFDVTGKEVLLQSSVSASKTEQINVSGLVNGVYILKVSNNDFVTIKKVVLNK